jgi:glycine cleavage system transcriptional repressor
MESHQIISLIARDRPGIVDEVSRIIAAENCNIDESRAAHLGGDFALMTLISGEGKAAETAAAKVRAWAEKAEMTAVTRRTTRPVGRPGAAAEIGIEAPDRQGIVNRVTHFLAERGANVETLETEVRPAPFSGTPIFSMQVKVSASDKLPLDELRRVLDSIARDEDIHITIEKSV